jgi:hypothetical protein
MKFAFLYFLVDEFIKSYEEYGSVGLPFSNDDCSETPIVWKVLTLSLVDIASMEQAAQALDRYTRDYSYIFEYFSRTGGYPGFCAKDYRCGKQNSFLQEHFTYRIDRSAGKSQYQWLAACSLPSLSYDFPTPPSVGSRYHEVLAVPPPSAFVFDPLLYPNI